MVGVQIAGALRKHLPNNGNSCTGNDFKTDQYWWRLFDSAGTAVRDSFRGNTRTTNRNTDKWLLFDNLKAGDYTLKVV